MSYDDVFGFAEPAIGFRPSPTDDPAERLARLRLIRSRRVGPATYIRLMGEHGEAIRALNALPDVAQAAGVRDYVACPEPVALAELRAAKRARAEMVSIGDPAYPDALAEIPDAPPIFWAAGDLSLLKRPMVALVGTRNVSAIGSRMARHLARDLGEAGFVVVSGLARGVDAIAHQAALSTGTVAVQAGGLDVMYPRENTDLARDIGNEGLRISEMPFGLHPQARHFPRRNRIVSGLSLAVIVVEAAVRSGSLITARLGLDQGREVMAVPGHPLDNRTAGANLLIRDGAVMVRGIQDIVEVLGHPNDAQSAKGTDRQAQDREMSSSPDPTPPEGGLEGAILGLLGGTPVPEDHLIRELNQTPRSVAQALAILELSGRITRSAGGMVALN